MQTNTIYYKFVPNDKQLNNCPNSFWSKYHNINDQNTHYISHLMKHFFAQGQEIKFNQYKKPMIDTGYFNVSHDNNLCVGVYDPNNSIGIDVVYIDKKINLSHLTNVFNIDESKDIYQFCRKEAYIKMIGMGLYMDLLDVNIINNKIYYKNVEQPYNIYETKIDEYFICIIGSFDSNQFKLSEFDI